MGFSRQRYWGRLPCPPPGDLPKPRIKSKSASRFFTTEPSGKPKNTRVGSLALLQGIFPTQKSIRGLLHWRQILYQLSYQGSPNLQTMEDKGIVYSWWEQIIMVLAKGWQRRSGLAMGSGAQASFSQCCVSIQWYLALPTTPEPSFSLWFLSLPCVSLLLVFGTCMFAWSHGHTVLHHHSTCLETWSRGRVKSVDPGIPFLSNHHGWHIDSWEPSPAALCQNAGWRLWGPVWQWSHFTHTETEAQRWRVNIFPKFCSWWARPRFSHSALTLLLFLARFSVEYKYFSGTYSM